MSEGRGTPLRSWEWVANKPFNFFKIYNCHQKILSKNKKKKNWSDRDFIFFIKEKMNVTSKVLRQYFVHNSRMHFKLYFIDPKSVKKVERWLLPPPTGVIPDTFNVGVPTCIYMNQGQKLSSSSNCCQYPPNFTSLVQWERCCCRLGISKTRHPS